MTKIAFYAMLKALFRLEIFTIVSLFVYVEKRIDNVAKKFMISQLPNIS